MMSMANSINLTPAVLDLILYAGDGARFEIDFVDKDDLPIDVSDLTWSAQIRKTRKTLEAVDMVIEDEDADTGVIFMVISADVTRNLARKSQWDIQGVLEGGDPFTFLQGSITCLPDVTREQVSA
jgi:hypothetical protein